MAVRLAAFPFAHGAIHRLPNGLALFDSYHCSRYNTNTGVLTQAMFVEVFSAARRRLGKPHAGRGRPGVALTDRRV
jgi:uracil-DNA glycosylase